MVFGTPVLNRFILSVSETIDGNNESACSPYTIKVYRLNEKDAGPIYENTQDSNTWNFRNQDIGQYQADIQQIVVVRLLKIT